MKREIINGNLGIPLWNKHTHQTGPTEKKGWVRLIKVHPLLGVVPLDRSDPAFISKLSGQTRPKRTFHLNFDRNFRTFWQNRKHPWFLLNSPPFWLLKLSSTVPVNEMQDRSEIGFLAT